MTDSIWNRKASALYAGAGAKHADALRDFYEERAAIREYCGNQSRQDAERDAFDELLGEFERLLDDI